MTIDAVQTANGWLPSSGRHEAAPSAPASFRMTTSELFGSQKIPVEYRDGRNGEITLRLIRISEIPAFLDISLDEAAALRFAATSPEPTPLDLDDLTDESYDRAVDANMALNFTRALAMSEAKLKRASGSATMLAGLAEQMRSLLARFSRDSVSGADTPPMK